MNNIFINSLIVLLLFGSCKGKAKVYTSFNNSLVGKPFIPEAIVWHQLDSNLKEYGGLYSNYRTLYFANDSIVYMFDCINNKKLVCKDTSIFDRVNQTYNDTVVCKYEDSILFGIENLEKYKGKYNANEDKIVCEMKKVISDMTLTNNPAFDEFVDTLKIEDVNHKITFFYKNQRYREALNFKKISYKKLLDFTNLIDTPFGPSVLSK
jgi:hypothetical protein